MKAKKNNNRFFLFIRAEGAGFEPAIPCGTHAFQACALGHYATLPFEFNSTKYQV